MAADQSVIIRPTSNADKSWMRAEIKNWWGNEMIVICGERFFSAEMAGFIAEIAHEKVGLILLRYDGTLCKIMSLTTASEKPGVGTQMIEHAAKNAKTNGILQMIVVTTNDNITVLRIYQQFGFEIREWRKGAVEKSHEIKPKIPLIGNYRIPIRDEIELEMTL